MYAQAEDYEAAFDEALDEDYGEARGRAGPRAMSRVPTARGSTYRPPVPAAIAGSAGTQAQLKEVVDRFNTALTTNGKAITQVDGRTRALDGGLRREMADRKKEITAVRRDLQSTREVGAIMPLLNLLAPGNTLVALAPMLLLGNDVSASTTGSDSASATANSGLLGSLGLGGGAGGSGIMGIAMLAVLSGALKV